MKNRFVLFILLFAFSFSAYSQVTLTWGIEDELTPIIKKAKVLKEELYKKTEGRVQLDLQLYGEQDETSLTTRDNIANKYDIHQLEISQYYHKHDFLRIWDIPFLFYSRAHVENYFKSESAQEILKIIEDKGRKNLAYTYAGGFLFMFTQKKISDFQSLVGLNCENDGDGQNFFKYFLWPKNIKGTINNNKSVDCAEILSSDLSTIFSEMEKGNYNYLILSRHRILPRVLSVATKKLEKLSEGDRKLVIDELTKVAKEEREAVYQGVDFIYETLRGRGLNVFEWGNKEKNKAIEFFKGGVAPYVKTLEKRASEEIEKIKKLPRK